jgi:hypothetical protein
MSRKSTLAVGLAVLALSVAGSSVAFAGELTGTGKPTAARANANSICAYSGQNDHPDAPLSLDPDVAPDGPGGVSQSFGQDVKLGADPREFNPGDACGPGTNPHRTK